MFALIFFVLSLYSFFVDSIGHGIVFLVLAFICGTAE